MTPRYEALPGPRIPRPRGYSVWDNKLGHQAPGTGKYKTYTAALARAAHLNDLLAKYGEPDAWGFFHPQRKP